MTSKRIPILYGTETGNAEYCADILAEAIEEEGFRVEPVDMGNYEPEAIRSEHLVFVITSTYGNGDPPSNARKVLEFIQKDDVEYTQLKFAVCALGDSSYVYFAQCGKDFDETFSKRGGQRVMERVDCDEDFDEPFETFKDGVIEYLQANKAELSDFLED